MPLVLSEIVTGPASSSAVQWPGGQGWLYARILSGSGTLQPECTTETLGGWVPCGDPLSSDGALMNAAPVGASVRLHAYGGTWKVELWSV